jgi:hypothetical protein
MLRKHNAFNDPLAQLVEHFTFNEGVDGSSPSRVTKFFLYIVPFV